jgi:serine/threonine protein kinase
MVAGREPPPAPDRDFVDIATKTCEMCESPCQAGNLTEFQDGPMKLNTCHAPQPLDSLSPGVAMVRSDQVVLGRILGQGTFCEVTESHFLAATHFDDSIQDPNCDSSYETSVTRQRCHSTTTIDSSRHSSTIDSSRHSEGSFSGGDRAYVIKSLRSEMRNRSHGLDGSESFAGALRDLEMEAQFLQKLEHPNIVTLHAVSELPPHDPGFFLVVDRLYETLAERLRHWAIRANKSTLDAKGPRSSLRQSRRLDTFRILGERLADAYSLGNAVAHLHDHRIVHRDLKTTNIGYDLHGCLKVFDFGLAVELPPVPKGNSGELTGNNGPVYEFGTCGSLRYMAPEVIMGRPYNAAVDVYALSLLVWQMLTLQLPYAQLSTESMFEESVCRKKDRPPLGEIPSSIATCIKTVLDQGWHPDVQVRSTIRQFQTGLDQVLQHHQNSARKCKRSCGLKSALERRWRQLEVRRRATSLE